MLIITLLQSLENQLDEITSGKIGWVKVLEEFLEGLSCEM